MIYFRRTVAVFLAFIAVVMLTPLLVVSRVNDTAGKPDFYISQLRQADAYNFVYSDILPAALQNTRLAVGSGESTIDLSWTKPDIISITKQTLPPDYLQAQTEQIIRAIVPYFIGDTQSFSVTIPLKERVQAGAQALKSTWHRPDFQNRIYDQLISYVVSRLSSSIQGLPVTVDQSTLQTIARQVFPPDWVVMQLDNAVDQVVPYFTGDRDHFTIQMNIADRLSTVGTVLANTLGLQGPARDLVTQALSQQLQQAAQFPTGVTLTDANLSSLLGGSYSSVQTARQTIAGGFSLTDAKLREWTSSGGKASSLDQVRSNLATARHLIPVGWIVLAAFLIFIGLLGGRRWSSKLIWAAAALGVAALAAIIVFGPVYSATLEPRLNQALAQAGSQPGTLEALISARAVTLAQNAIGVFLGGLRTETIILLLVAVALIVVGSIWHMRGRTGRTTI